MPFKNLIQFDTTILHRPETAELRFLPEGPMPLPDDRISWVAIQHGESATHGSLNILDLNDGSCASYPLPGRPGFAFPTTDPDQFVIGLERHVQRFDIHTGKCLLLSDEVDAGVEGTIINDGVAVPEGIVFGTKDLQFSEPKAGLYLWHNDGELMQLCGGQFCSNGKDLHRHDGRTWLVDIDSPTKQIVEYELDLADGRLGERRVLIDLTTDESFPDGMVLTPDERSLIVAMYNPTDAEYGEARQYSLGGELQAVWRTPLSPQVTCPQLIRWQGRVRLVLTTAVEYMTPERQQQYPNAGCLFIGDTPFTRLRPTPQLDFMQVT